MTIEKDLLLAIEFAAQNSPYYREQPWVRKLHSKKILDLQELPITSKARVRSCPPDFHVTEIPATEGGTIDKFTSGTTGEPMHVRKTQRHFAVNSFENSRLKTGWGIKTATNTLRLKNSHGDDRDGTMTTQYTINNRKIFTLFSLASKPAAEIINTHKIEHISGYPSAVLGAMLELPVKPWLKIISTVGEVIPEMLRQQIREVDGLRHYDIYGLIELGVAAGTCALCGNYHPADRHLTMEVIDDHGRPTEPGATGRVVCTPLFNMAMPLLRYDTGDLAEISTQNNCPVSPTTITRFLGRERDLFTLSNGSRITPMIASQVRFASTAPIKR